MDQVAPVDALIQTEPVQETWVAAKWRSYVDGAYGVFRGPYLVVLRDSAPGLIGWAGSPHYFYAMPTMEFTVLHVFGIVFRPLLSSGTREESEGYDEAVARFEALFDAMYPPNISNYVGVDPAWVSPDGVYYPVVANDIHSLANRLENLIYPNDISRVRSTSASEFLRKKGWMSIREQFVSLRYNAGVPDMTPAQVARLGQLIVAIDADPTTSGVKAELRRSASAILLSYSRNQSALEQANH